MTGMELAYALRDSGNRVSIIFVAASEAYLSEGYSVQPIHFLRKPIKKESLVHALRTDLKLNYLPKKVLLHIGRKTVSLTLADIRYIESFNHEVLVHQGRTKQTYALSLTEMERQLPIGQFCRCHNSYLVNLSYVQEVGRTKLTLQEQEILPVGRTYYKAFLEMFIRYNKQ